ncbi:MAG TPA: ABC transporter permease [Candidatus Thalassarchaeaceae archaeon]|nr:ABC transporter permease [Candidatus Thalassarchaeaceae archaeon]|tara:strand:- start:3566 stop:6655 length:3090 start_codon:yes stop_codon:yes gene_type:complete
MIGSVFRELTLRDLLRLVVSVLIIMIVYWNREITALSVSIILLLSIIIPERHKLIERAWGAFSPAFDIVSFVPDSDDLATRFSSSMQTFRDAWKGFRRSLLSVVGLLMVVLVIDISLFADHIAQEHQQETLSGQELWPIYVDDPETAEPVVTYAYKKLPPFEGPKVDSVTSAPSDEDQKLQLDVQTANGDDDNDGDLVTNFYDMDDDNDGILDFQDFMFPNDFDEDGTATCDSNIWFDNSTGMYCGPDWADLDDDGDGIPDYDEVSDDDPLTDIYDSNNDGIQECVGGSASDSTTYLRIHHDTGADPSYLNIQIFSVFVDSEGGSWDCTGCVSGEIEGTHGSFAIDEETGYWNYGMSTVTNAVSVATTSSIALSGFLEPTGVLTYGEYDTLVPTDVLTDGAYDTIEATGVLVTGTYVRDNTSSIALHSVDATTMFEANDNVYDSSGIEVGIIERVTPNEIIFSGNIAVSLQENEDLRRGQTVIPVDSVDATTMFAVDERVYDSSGNLIGTIATVTATQINLTGNIAVALPDNENLHRGQTVIPVDSVDATTMFAANDRLYDSSGIVVGTIETVTATQINLTGNIAVALPDNENLHREMSIDGVSIKSGDRVLVKDQNDLSDNGIYVVTSGSWFRLDYTSIYTTSGLYVWIEEGITNGYQWILTSNDDPSTNSPSFSEFSGIWVENFPIQHSNASGQISESHINISIAALNEPPIVTNPFSNPPDDPDDEWFALEVPKDAEMAADLSVESGSDYNLFLYTELGADFDSSRLDNGCPDFYSYDWMPEGYELCPFGTTHTGSDMMSKILYGSRKSLRVGFTVALITCFLGLVVGGISGYYGRWVDEVIMRIADVFFAVPGLILAMAVVAAMYNIHDLGRIGMPDVKLDRLEKIMIALVFTGWPGYSRLIRGQVLYVKEHTYVEAAKSVGSSDFRILFRHVLPNAWAPMLVAVSLDIGGTILTAAGLSFIGLGADALSAEWGKMIADGRAFFPVHWWMVTFPGIAILITTLGFNLLGDGLRDVFDPKQRRSKS